jgi:AcrR family transcriptional regulator
MQSQSNKLMPKAFSDQERGQIAEALLAHGLRLFTAQGLRKTSVEELTAASSISKGAFYLFFESKEELFFELLERHESRYKSELLARVVGGGPPRERMRELLRWALAAWRREPLFTRLGRAEYEQLLRRLPPARVARHLEGDETFAATFAAAWAARGVTLAAPPRLVSGLIRSLFFVSLHEEEFERGIFPEVMAQLVDMLAERLVPAEGADQ